VSKVFVGLLPSPASAGAFGALIIALIEIQKTYRYHYGAELGILARSGGTFAVPIRMGVASQH